MTLAACTFKADYENGYDTEYGNDLDYEGYISGIELNLTAKEFINLIENQAFKIYRTEWKNREFHLVTFDHLENALNPENFIYKLNDKEDAFVIVKLEKPEKLGYQYTSEREKRPIALFKGLISARNDIYPLNYLMKPEFYLRKDVGLQFINDDLWCTIDAFGIWESITEITRDDTLNNVYCGQCSTSAKIVDCTIHKETYGLLLRGKCSSCGQHLARIVKSE